MHEHGEGEGPWRMSAGVQCHVWMHRERGKEMDLDYEFDELPVK